MQLPFSIAIMLLLFSIPLQAQRQPSIHQAENDYYKTHAWQPPLVKEVARRGDLLAPMSLSKKIYGFHPYWVSDATAAGYYYSLLTHVVYFSAEVDTGVATSGGFITTRNWATTQVVTYAQAAGVKVHLCITAFGNHSRVLVNTTIRTNLVKNIMTQLRLRNADGANIDFEAMSASDATTFRAFIKELGDSCAAAGKELVVELPAVDWDGIFTSTFFSTVNSVVTYYFLMAYDYYYRGSSTAGPVAPLTTGTSIYHVMRSINTYITNGATTQRLIAGFPYYGYDWPVTGSSRMAATTGSATSRTWSYIAPLLDTINASNLFFDATYNSPWYRYQSSGNWRQVWFEDSTSLAKKYDSINAKGIAGTGMWALSYDGSYTDYWGALKKAFASSNNALFTNLADFDYGAGNFNRQPTFSGSTAGIMSTSTAAYDVSQARNGMGSLKVVLKDSTTIPTNWSVRLLSGSGSIGSNTTLNSSGYIGFWMKCSSAPAGAQVAVTIDDGPAAGPTELSPKLNVVADGTWALYQFNLQGTGWSSFSGGNGSIGGPTVTLDAIMFYAPNQAQDWTLYIDDVSYYQSGPLPAELISFTAAIRKGAPVLTWNTATEQNTSHFSIERTTVYSGSAAVWEQLGTVQAAGNSNSARHYTYTDARAAAGTCTYRLKIVDTDGSFRYSGSVTIEVAPPAEFSVAQNYPNPFNPVTVIGYRIPEESRVTLEVYNLSGEKVYSMAAGVKAAGYYQHAFDAGKAGIASGVYLYRVTAVTGSGETRSAAKKMAYIR